MSDEHCSSLRCHRTGDKMSQTVFAPRFMDRPAAVTGPAINWRPGAVRPMSSRRRIPKALTGSEAK